MKKVGIVTIFKAKSHGARLQAFAPSDPHSSLAWEPRLVNYAPPQPVSGRGGCLRRLYRRASRLRFGKRFRLHDERFDRFTDRYLPLTEPFDREELDRNLSDRFDAFICGSDQIWRIADWGFYFLDFVHPDGKKIAYAPSFGTTNAFTTAEREVIHARLETFRSLSVREEEGASFLREILHQDVPVVLDPTFLIETRRWREIALPPDPPVPKDYVLLFTVQNTVAGFEVAKQVARLLRLPIVAVDTARRLLWRSGLVNRFDAGPEELLGLIDHATFVVTTSFHGTAFAMNFHKPFLTVRQGAKINVNSRMETLLKTFRLEDRLLSPGQTIAKRDLPLSFEESDAILTVKRRDSLDYLERALKSSEGER